MVALPSYNLGVALPHLHSSLLGPCRAQKRDGSLSLHRMQLYQS
jgi:hypothetical protein